jgi:polyhydroxybutyrate depolymerase
MAISIRTLLIGIFASFGSSTWANEGKHGEFASETLKVNGTREYRLVVPKTVDRSKPAPLIVAFHGIGIDNKDLMPKYTKLNEAAEKYQFILTYPNAIGKSWGLVPDKVKSEIAFFDALLEHLTAKYKIDSDRIYVTGMSNGGYFSHLVGKERFSYPS